MSTEMGGTEPVDGTEPVGATEPGGGTEPAGVTEPVVRARTVATTDSERRDPTLIRAGLRDYLELERRDVITVLALIVVAFAIRFASPVFLPFLDHPFQGTQVAIWGVGHTYNYSECSDVPVPPGAPPKGTAPSMSPAGTAPYEQNVPTAHYCGYVFDEIYFPNDAAKDLHQPAVTYFDPEPPLTKLLMTPPLQWWGFNTWTWRTSTVFFGSLLAGVMYLIALRLRRDRFFATVAGGLVCIDGLALVESRIGVIDIIAIFWVALYIYTFLLHWQARTRRQWRATLYFMAAVGGLAFAAKLTALAPTALFAVLIAARFLERPAVRLIPWLDRLRARRDIGPELWRQAASWEAVPHYIAASVLVVIIFCVSWSRFLTVPQAYYEFTSCSVQNGLQGTTLVTTPITQGAVHVGPVTIPNPGNAITNIYKVFRAGLKYHATECHGHPYASRWWEWPIMKHPVLFYYSGTDTDINGIPNTASITNAGNPAIWWTGLFAILFCAWRMLTGPWWWRTAVTALGAGGLTGMIWFWLKAQQPDQVVNGTTFTLPMHPGIGFTVCFVAMAAFGGIAAVSAVIGRRFVPAFIVMGYELAWFMWVPGNELRVLFFYHALGMFLFMVLAIAYMLTAIRRLPWRLGTYQLTYAPISYGMLALMVAAFVFFYPVWTAQPLPAPDHAMRIWFDSW